MKLKRTLASNALDAEPLRAVSLIRPMIGKLGPVLVTATDSAAYVVKTWGNVRHPNALANEHLASVLCAAAGLPVPPSKPIELTRQFLNSGSLSAFYEGYAHHPEPGIHYASPLILHNREDAFLIEYLGQRLVRFVQNRRDFLGMYMLDICFKHRGPRKAIFIKSKNGPASQAVFIDHDQMFGGSNWETVAASGNPCHRTTELYHGLSVEKDVTSWLRTFDAKLPFAVDSAVKQLPSEWYTGNVTSLHEWLHQRIQSLPELIGQMLTQNPVFREHVDATMHISSPRIYQIGP